MSVTLVEALSRHFMSVLFKVVVCQRSLCEHLGKEVQEEGEWRAGTGTMHCRCCYPEDWDYALQVLLSRRLVWSSDSARRPESAGTWK